MSCRFSTCLQLWQGKEVGYSWDSPTCAWRWIWPKWPKKAFHAPQSRKRNILLRNHAPRSKKRRSGVLSFLGTKRWRLRYKDTRQCFIKTKRPAAFIAKMATQTIRRHAGDMKEQVHLHLTDAESGLQSWLHHCPERHPPQPVTLPEFNLLKSLICLPDIRIRMHLIPVWNFSMMRIPSTIPILIQICWLMKVSTLSVVWWCSEQSFRRKQQRIERSFN